MWWVNWPVASAPGAAPPGGLAKSWICHGGINRRAPVLPWNAPENGPDFSLTGLGAVFGAPQVHLGGRTPQCPLGPARSYHHCAGFDEAAGELTIDAAKEAGYGKTFGSLKSPKRPFTIVAPKQKAPANNWQRPNWCWWWMWVAAPPT